MRLISVVMGEDTSQNRTTDTVSLLNYGFNTYKLNTIVSKDTKIGKIKINKGKIENVELQVKDDVTELLSVNEKAKEYTLDVQTDNINAPVKIGTKVGVLHVKYKNKTIYEVDLTVKENVNKANIWDLYKRNFKRIISGN